MTRRALRIACAVATFAAAAPAAPARASLDDAERAWQSGDAPRAAELLREHLAKNPDDATSPRALALLGRTDADPGAAMAHWESLLERESSGKLAAEAHWHRGLHAYSAGLYLGATEHFGVLADQFKGEFDRGRALLWRGRAELGAEKLAEALDTLREAERASRDAEDRRTVELTIAHVEFRLGNVGEALRRYERFEREHRSDGRASSAARRTVECLRLLGREDEASSRAAHVEQQYPSSVEATLVRAATRESEARANPTDVAEAPPPQGPFLVQVAALADPKNAVRLRRRVQALGFTVSLQLGDGPQGPVNRVLIGPFDDAAEAQAVADSVATLGDVSPRVREAAAVRTSAD